RHPGQERPAIRDPRAIGREGLVVSGQVLERLALAMPGAAAIMAIRTVVGVGPVECLPDGDGLAVRSEGFARTPGVGKRTPEDVVAGRQETSKSRVERLVSPETLDQRNRAAEIAVGVVPAALAVFHHGETVEGPAQCLLNGEVRRMLTCNRFEVNAGAVTQG